ncbi:Hpt domain-containing protein [Flaviramulus aquimarinus]|uniref:Hpt domain-containing protein n=1 Tax=Flaviramulus aquimarinus TaxID=1170456 RepID=A0ABP9FF65_9FLAO
MEQPNLSYINKLSGGDKAFEDKLIAIIKAEYPKEKTVYMKNVECNNFKEAAENVHKLKHKISILGLEKSYEVANGFEENLKENSLAGKQDFEIILKNITDFLATI